MQDCIFCKIVRGEIPAKKVYEDDDVLAFHDIHRWRRCICWSSPSATSRRWPTPATADAAVLGRMLALTGRLARDNGSPDGYRTIVNTGRIGRQDVKHVHIHVLGGPDPLGPMLPRH